MPKCIYCGQLYDVPYGLTIVMNDGRVLSLCSSKCRKNMAMKRRNVKWIKKSGKEQEETAKEKKE
jgi:ribosomal protein L24E